MSKLPDKSRLQGYDGSDWVDLKTDAKANLRIIKMKPGTDSSLATSRTDQDALSTTSIIDATVAFPMGFNGTTWDRLRVESSTAPNLRTSLYSASRRAEVSGFDADGQAGSTYGLHTKDFLFGYNGSTWDRIRIADKRADLDRAAFTAGQEKTIIAAPGAGVKWRIHQLIVTASGATVLTFKDGTTGQIYLELEFAGAGNEIINFSPNGLLADNANEAFTVTSSAAVSVGVHALYNTE